MTAASFDIIEYKYSWMDFLVLEKHVPMIPANKEYKKCESQNDCYYSDAIHDDDDPLSAIGILGNLYTIQEEDSSFSDGESEAPNDSFLSNFCNTSKDFKASYYDLPDLMKHAENKWKKEHESCKDEGYFISNSTSSWGQFVPSDDKIQEAICSKKIAVADYFYSNHANGAQFLSSNDSIIEESIFSKTIASITVTNPNQEVTVISTWEKDIHSNDADEKEVECYYFGLFTFIGEISRIVMKQTKKLLSAWNMTK